MLDLSDCLIRWLCGIRKAGLLDGPKPEFWHWLNLAAATGTYRQRALGQGISRAIAYLLAVNGICNGAGFGLLFNHGHRNSSHFLRQPLLADSLALLHPGPIHMRVRAHTVRMVRCILSPCARKMFKRKAEADFASDCSPVDKGP